MGKKQCKKPSRYISTDDEKYKKKKIKCDIIVDKGLSLLKENMAEYEENRKDDENNTSDTENSETSEECNPASDKDNETDKISKTMAKKLHEEPKVQEISSSTVNFNNNDMAAMNMYGCSYGNKDPQPSASCITEGNYWINPLMYSSHYYNPSLIPVPINNVIPSTSDGQPYHSTNQTICTPPDKTSTSAIKINEDKDIQKIAKNEVKKCKITNMENFNIPDLKKIITDRFDKMDKKLETLKTLLTDFQKTVQQNTMKISYLPNLLPINSNESLQKFQDCSNEEFNNCVSYFSYIGGFNPKECASLIIKKAFTDDYAVQVTWTGYKNTIAIAPLKITTAICEAILRNRNFSQPSLLELQDAISDGLRNAKQRVRNNKENTTVKRKRSALTEILKDNLSRSNN